MNITIENTLMREVESAYNPAYYVYGPTKEAAENAVAERLGISGELLSGFLTNLKHKIINIPFEVHVLGAGGSYCKSLEAYFEDYIQKNSLYFANNVEDIPDTESSLNEFVTSEVVGASLSQIRDAVVTPHNDLVDNISTEKFAELFPSITWYKHQERAIREGNVALLEDRRAFWYLGEMGVGKTLTSSAMIEIVKNLRSENDIDEVDAPGNPAKVKTESTLVVAPSHLLTKWRDEILSLDASLTVAIYEEQENGIIKDVAAENDYVIIGYPTIKKMSAVFTAEACMSLFRYAIWDESHNLNGQSWKQPLEEGLRLAARNNIFATGTSITGEASNVFNVYHNFHFKNKNEHVHDINAFVRRYGNYHEMCSSRSSKAISDIGINPAFIAEVILPNSIFLTTDQVWEDRVENTFIPPILVEMTPGQKMAMKSVQEVFKVASEEEDYRLMSRILKLQNEYLDNPDVKDIVYKDDLLFSAKPLFMFHSLKEGVLLPKEEKLLDIIKTEKSQDRPVIVFATYYDRLKGRLQKVIKDAGYNVGTLPSSVKQTDRQNYINRKFLSEGVDVMIVNPSQVATGVDLISSPTIVFFNTGFSYYEVGQAERRTYRIGQKRNTRVYYLAYKSDTESNLTSVQEEALKLIAQKKRAMESVQGVIDEEGLANMLGKDTNSILNMLSTKVMNNTIDDDNNDDIIISDNAKYLLAHLGEELTVEDAGRPKYVKGKVIFDSAQETETVVAEIEVRIEKEIDSIQPEESEETSEQGEEVEFVFEDSGQMCLFNF